MTQSKARSKSKIASLQTLLSEQQITIANLYSKLNALNSTPTYGHPQLTNSWMTSRTNSERILAMPVVVYH